MRSFVAIILAAFLPGSSVMKPTAANAAEAYVPPVEREANQEPNWYFGRLKSTGMWCAFDRKSWHQAVDRERVVPDEFGWLRTDSHNIQSITVAQRSEDAYSEDRYFIGPGKQVSRMVRTGHYINDPPASVTFEPDQQGRLRLTAASKVIVQKMDAAGYDPYFVRWDHLSKLSQIPFARLIDVDNGDVRAGC